jgi:hypothetical protein
MKLSSILVVIGLVLWAVLGYVVLSNNYNKEMALTWVTTVGIFVLFYFCFYFKRMEENERTNNSPY